MSKIQMNSNQNKEIERKLKSLQRQIPQMENSIEKAKEILSYAEDHPTQKLEFIPSISNIKNILQNTLRIKIQKEKDLKSKLIIC